MSKPLDELLFKIRQDPAFQELLDAVEAPTFKAFSLGRDVMSQHAEHIYRSGRRLQHELWRQFLIGEPTSQTEKP